MFIRVKPLSEPGKRSVQLCESRREGQKVRQVAVRHIGTARDNEEEKQLREMAKLVMVKVEQSSVATQPLFSARQLINGVRLRTRRSSNVEASAALEPARVAAESSLQLDLRNVVEESRQVEGIGEVLGWVYDDLGLDTVLSGAPKPVLKATVLARIAEPTSKRKTRTILEQSYGETYSLERLYRMMDALSKRSLLRYGFRKRSIVSASDALCLRSLPSTRKNKHIARSLPHWVIRSGR